MYKKNGEICKLESLCIFLSPPTSVSIELDDGV